MSPLFSIKPEAVAIIDAADKHAILEQLSRAFAASYALDAGQVLDHLEERERLGIQAGRASAQTEGGRQASWTGYAEGGLIGNLQPQACDGAFTA